MLIKTKFYKLKYDKYVLIDTLDINFEKKFNNILTLEPNSLLLSFFHYDKKLFEKCIKSLFESIDYDSFIDNEIIVMMDIINGSVNIDTCFPDHFKTRLEDYFTSLYTPELIDNKGAQILTKNKVNLILDEYKNYISDEILMEILMNHQSSVIKYLEG